MTQEFFGSPLPRGFYTKRFFLYYIIIYLFNFGYCFASIILEFTDLFIFEQMLFLFYLHYYLVLPQKIAMQLLLLQNMSGVWFSLEQNSYHVFATYNYENL